VIQTRAKPAFEPANFIVGLLSQKDKREKPMTCLRCKHQEAKRFGIYGRKRIQRYRCPGCNATFSEPRRKLLGRHYTDPAKAAQIVNLLLEGMSVRAVSRITGAHQGTILSLLLTVGENCRNLFDKRVRGIRPRFVQADELWTFVHTKERHMRPGSPVEWGDAYVWMAIDSETKMVLSYLVAKREAVSAYNFIRDLSERVTGRFQLTTDGLRSYVPAVEEYFGADVDFAQLLKLYGTNDGEGPEWYNPSKVTATIPIVISGDPDEARISTSHVERANLSVRNTPATLHTPEFGIQQNAGPSQGRDLALYGFLQLRSRTSDSPRYARNAGRANRSHLDRARTLGGTVKRWLSLHIRSPPPATLNWSTTAPPRTAWKS
jgi:transposase-like protein